MTTPTHDDAMVMLRLMQLGSTPEMNRANEFVWGDDSVLDYKAFIKKYPVSSPQYTHVANVLGWYETLATLWKHKLFDETLLFDWIVVRRRWTRLEPFVRGVREETGEPRFWENFEALAAAEA